MASDMLSRFRSKHEVSEYLEFATMLTLMPSFLLVGHEDLESD